MAWYKSGLVDVVNGQTHVTGISTRFAANVRVGDGFQGPDGEWYEVLNVASDLVIGIFPAYHGPSVSGAEYTIAPLQGYVKESADRLREITDGMRDVTADVSAAKAAREGAESARDAARLAEGNAKTSETNAAGSETRAKASEDASKASETAASNSEDAAKLSEDASKASELAAKGSQDASKVSQDAAAASALAAKNSEDAAKLSENNSKTSENNAKTSETNSKTSETNAKASEDSASADATATAADVVAADAARVRAEKARDDAIAAAGTVTGNLLDMGAWDASTGVYPAKPLVSAFWKVVGNGSATDAGETIEYGIGDSLVWSKPLEVFYKIDNTEAVSSVNGQTGVVVLDKSDVGLPKVDNTSDMEKPVSTPQKTALDAKQDKHVNLTGLSGVTSAADKVPMFSGAGGSMTTLDAGVSGKTLLATNNFDQVRTLIEYTRPVTDGFKNTGSFNEWQSPGWAPVMYGHALTNSPSSVAGGPPLAPYWWYLHNTFAKGSGDGLIQIAYPYATNDNERGFICWRHRYQGAWTQWQRALTQQDLVANGYDNTANKVVATNAAGYWMGVGAPSLPVVTQGLDAINMTCFYTFNENTPGRPPMFGYGNVMTICRNVNERTQIAYSVVSDSTATRKMLNNVWGPWILDYNQTNVVGPVSYDGNRGNSGAIIERGSGPQGQWTRFADGTLECFGQLAYSCPQSAGEVPATVAIALPFNYADTQYVAQAWAQPHANWAGFSGVLACISQTTSYFNVAIRNTSGPQTVNVGWRVIGRWR